MAGKGPGGSGGGTPFEGMSHEQMLAWLDQADSGTVQAAADKLVSAAEEIRKIAEELKIRPQWVEWKGEGADAFRTWAGDLANSALRLADFSGESGKWLSQASSAIATAQASIPRDASSASANLAAAQAHHNDPDADSVAAKSAAELAALKAHKEKVRQEAAGEMRKLAQAYDLSATQMDGLERPQFPPPPKQVGVEQMTDLARPGTGDSKSGDAEYGDATTSGAGSSARAVAAQAAPTGRSGDAASMTSVPAETYRPETIDQPVHVEIDSVGTLPETHHPVTGPGPTVGPATPTRPEPMLPPTVTGMIPPTSGRGGGRPTVSGGGGRPITGGRTPFGSGQGGTGLPRGRDILGGGPLPHGPASGTAAGGPAPGQGLGGPGRNVPLASGTTVGRPADSGVMGGRPASPGIVGGRPTNQGIAGGRTPATPAAGKPAGRLPGGTVVGGGPAANRGPTAPVPALGPTGPSSAARPGATTNAGRPLSTPNGGVLGGTPQRKGPATARPGAPVPSAPTRGGISGGTPSDGGDRSSTRRTAGQAKGAPRVQGQQTDRRNASSPAD